MRHVAHCCEMKGFYAPEDCVRLLKAGYKRGFIKTANASIIKKALNGLEQKILDKTATYEDNVVYALTRRWSWINDFKDISEYEVHPIIKVLLSDNPLKEILRDEKSTILDHIETANVLLKESVIHRIDSIEYFNALLSEKLNNRQLDLLICYFKLFTNDFHKLKKYERKQIVTLLSEHGCRS